MALYGSIRSSAKLKALSWLSWCIPNVGWNPACHPKKSEVIKGHEDLNADYALTYGEIRAILKAKDVTLIPEENINQQASVYGKRFGNGGGVSAAVLSAMQEAGTDTSNITVEVCDGADDRSIEDNIHACNLEHIPMTKNK